MRRVSGLLFAAAMFCGPPSARAADYPGAWVQYVADGGLEIRSIVAPGMNCPALVADGIPVASEERGAPTPAYAVKVCAGRVPEGARSLNADGLPLPLPPRALRRIVVLGDTGCRLKGAAVQDCNSPAAWPFDTIARRAAAQRPDLIIHVGDYHYRESACPEGRPGCAGSPFGDNWAVWQRDFFNQAGPLLAAAPWVMVRGNHESCDRGGIGWFRLLEPRPTTTCTAMTEPYALSIAGQQLLIFDGADADDPKAPPEKVAAYRPQFASLLAQAKPRAWLLTHRPIWSLAQFAGAPGGVTLNATEQEAIRGLVPPQLDMVIAGHVHSFMSFDFGPARPAQLVVGNGGDANDAITQPITPGAMIDGVPIRRGMGVGDYGYLVLDRREGGWAGTLRGLDDAVLARCTLYGRSVNCVKTPGR